MRKITLLLLPLMVSLACKSHKNTTPQDTAVIEQTKQANFDSIPFDTTAKVIHLLVALCDNKYQGIVPVPAAIGNGQDKENNLYWGCSAGIRTYFKNSSNWKMVKKYSIDSIRLERIIFKHSSGNYYLVADAYNGKYIQQCTIDFLKSCSGQYKDTLHLNKMVMGINGHAKLIAYIGHDGLMDFRLKENIANTDNRKRDAIMLACISKRYFSNHIALAKANPILWSTGLMCPEAYTLHDALETYIRNGSTEQVRTAAARAYSRYQKCSEKAARNLLVSGL